MKRTPRHIAQPALLICCFCLVAAASPSATADDAAATAGSPIAFLRAHDREVTALVGSPGDSLAPAIRQQVKSLINGVFDFEELSRLTLADIWAEISDEQRREFVEVYGGLVQEQNFDRFVKYYRESKFRYRSEELDGDRATVHATVPVEAEELPLTFLLQRRDPAQPWRVCDLVVDGTSTAQVNGRSYTRYIRRNSYDRLVEQLRGQLDKLQGHS